MKKKTKIQKEYQDILDAIDRWIKKNNDKVSFIPSFVTFDENDDVREDECGYYCYGSKDVIGILIEESRKELEKEKDDFFNSNNWLWSINFSMEKKILKEKKKFGHIDVEMSKMTEWKKQKSQRKYKTNNDFIDNYFLLLKKNDLKFMSLYNEQRSLNTIKYY